MPRPPIDIHAKIVGILDHVGAMPGESESPLAHYNLATNGVMSMRRYLKQKTEGTNFYPAVLDRHLFMLNNMVLVNLIQAFERFLKDLAVVCVDELFDKVADDRYDGLELKGGSIAAHFKASTAGRALCEAGTWLDCKSINSRYRVFLKHVDPRKTTEFNVFDTNSSAADSMRIMGLIWQLRNSVVHNVGVLTTSDATKLRLLARKPIGSPMLLMPDENDLLHLKKHLDDQSQDINKRAGVRLAEILTDLHGLDSTLFEPQTQADSATKKFGFPLTVAGKTGNP